jgi:hypothetical protein
MSDEIAQLIAELRFRTNCESGYDKDDHLQEILTEAARALELLAAEPTERERNRFQQAYAMRRMTVRMGGADIDELERIDDAFKAAHAARLKEVVDAIRG